MEDEPAMERDRSSSMSVRVNAVRVAMDPMLSMIVPMFSWSHLRNFVRVLLLFVLLLLLL